VRVDRVSRVQPYTQGYYRKGQKNNQGRIVDLNTYRESKQDVKEPETNVVDRFEGLDKLLWNVSLVTMAFGVSYILAQLARWLLG
jgi:hypothetical protein